MEANHPTARTCRHLATGTRVWHREYGTGTVCERENGERYPRFDSGASGTSMTRVYTDR